MQQSKYVNNTRRVAMEDIAFTGGMNAGKSWPLGLQAICPGEAATIETDLQLQLAPVAGRMRSNAYAHVVQIAVPYQAIHALRNADAIDQAVKDQAGVTEVIRRQLLNGASFGGLQDPSDIERAAWVHPRRIGGEVRVHANLRSAYNVAVNTLRKRKYHDAALRTEADNTIAPATVTATTLERHNGVLDPERHIDGAIRFPNIPIDGIYGRSDAPGQDHSATVSDPLVDHKGDPADLTDTSATWGGLDYNQLYVKRDPVTGAVKLEADMGAVQPNMRDLMQAEILDGLVRSMAKRIEQDPENGEQAVERMLFNLKVDRDDEPMMLYERVFEMRPTHSTPMDGPSFDDVIGRFSLDANFTTLVPRMELGGVVVTIVMVKPLEVMPFQPNPRSTREWDLINVIEDQMDLEEELLTRADLESVVTPEQEDAPAFWVGNNQLYHSYRTVGVNTEALNPTESRSTMWTHTLPASVDAENVNYPADFGTGDEMYPFYNWNGAHAEYNIRQQTLRATPRALGPNPVERIKLFEEKPELIDGDENET